ncbi:MAG: hypothetical protein K6D97_04010 [Clostridia bacterium]|nr:hypothetical protein [Clostridia bacterium]
MSQKINKNSWRKLDNSAKIFPLSASKKYSTVFRYSAVLKECIDKEILEKAVEKALVRYKAFKVKMKSGFFWFYFEENKKKPIVKEELYYPCKRIDPLSNNDYLFSVTYFERKINIEIFHSLTDGSGGLIFFREIIYNYLEMTHKELLNMEERKTRRVEFDTEDSYMANFEKKAKDNGSGKRAYILKGKELKFNQVSVNHLMINNDDLKNECTKYNVSTTQYLTSVLIWAVYNVNVLRHEKNHKNKKPIKVCIPVNLKKYFKSNTMSNFFSFISIDAEMEKCDSFERITEFVKSEFEHKLTEEEILKTMSGTVRIGNNIFISFIPLFLKIIIIRSIYREIQKYFSITYSNVGKVGIIKKYQDYIESFMVLIAPEHIEKIKCSSCTYIDKVIFTFTSVLNDNSIEKFFYNFLKEQNVKVEVESNQVLNSIEDGEKNVISTEN